MTKAFGAERAALTGEAEELKVGAEQAQAELMEKTAAEKSLRR
jgi:hypothetical protein